MDGRSAKSRGRRASPFLPALGLLALAACADGRIDPDTFELLSDPVGDGAGRSFHAAVVVPRGLGDWDVMLVGGQDATGLPLTADRYAERYRWTTRRFIAEQAFDSATGRVDPVAAYAGSMVVAAGGQVTGVTGAAAGPQYLSLGPPAVADGERYDPGTLQASALALAGGAAGAALVSDGTDLYLVGGRAQGGTLTGAIRVYDPGGARFVATASSLSTPREGHTATLLSTGEILVAGGWDQAGAVLQSAELFDPGTGSVSTRTMTLPRAAHTATPSADRARVVLFGGFKGLGALAGTVAPDEVAEIYDAGLGTFTRVTWVTPAPMPRVYHAAVRLPGGNTWVVGGVTDDAGTLTDTAQEVEPETGVVRDTADRLAFARFGHTATLLPDGTVLVAGGLTAPGTAASRAERYFPLVR